MQATAEIDTLLLGVPAHSGVTDPVAHRLGPDPEPLGVRFDALRLAGWFIVRKHDAPLEEVARS
jgi:hypothetical protein